MNEPTNSHRRSKVSQTLFLLIVYVVVGLSLGSGVAYFYFQAKKNRALAETEVVWKGGEPAADSWLEQVRSGNLAKALEATSPAFRGRVDLASFQALVANHPGFQTAPVSRGWMKSGGYIGTSIGLNGVRFESNPSLFTLMGELRRKAGATPEDFELVIVKDTYTDRLLVDQIRFKPDLVSRHN